MVGGKSRLRAQIQAAAENATHQYPNSTSGMREPCIRIVAPARSQANPPRRECEDMRPSIDVLAVGVPDRGNELDWRYHQDRHRDCHMSEITKLAIEKRERRVRLARGDIDHRIVDEPGRRDPIAVQ